MYTFNRNCTRLRGFTNIPSHKRICINQNTLNDESRSSIGALSLSISKLYLPLESPLYKGGHWSCKRCCNLDPGDGFRVLWEAFMAKKLWRIQMVQRYCFWLTDHLSILSTIIPRVMLYFNGKLDGISWDWVAESTTQYTYIHTHIHTWFDTLFIHVYMCLKNICTVSRYIYIIFISIYIYMCL